MEALERLEESMKAAGPIPEAVRWDLEDLRRKIETAEESAKTRKSEAAGLPL